MDRAEKPYFVAIGASGSEGLDDIRNLLHALLSPLDAIVVVVLHRPSDRISHLAEVLQRSSRIPVMVACEAENMRPGNCYVGEPAAHLTLVDADAAHLILDTDGLLRNRTIDALFESLARRAGARTLGIILSGALDDGSRGLAAIHAAGGLTMVLEPGRKPRGMQQNAIDFDGTVGFVGSGADIAVLVTAEVRHHRPSAGVSAMR